MLLAAMACGEGEPRYRDPSRSPAERAADLLGRMTVEEKFWQLFAIPDDTTLDLSRLRHGVYGLQVRPGPGGGAREVAARINVVQRFLVTQTRLGIPMIPFEEGLHGLQQGGATVFPQAIALAATWDTALAGDVAAATAREARARGIRQVLSPVLNLATDVRWGRVEETFGEDPYLASRLGVAFVRAFETAGVVTTPKHFVANVGDGGRDSYPVEPSHRWLEELHFPPFRAAIAEAGARSVMASYNSVDGSPATASRWLLTEQLRNGWRFDGVVISDAGAVGGANVLHMTASDYPDAARRALEAGLDVILQTSADHAALFLPAFTGGAIARPVIDSAVARVLRLKFQLGLFDDPYVAFDSAGEHAMFAQHRRLAREAAAASLTMLHNDRNVLPIAPEARTVAVIGADAVEARLGGYSGPGLHPTSIRDAIAARLGATGRVRFARGPGRGRPALVPVPPDALGDGLAGEYFANIALDGPPVVTRTDRAIDFRWPFGGPDAALAFGWYSARWRGTLRAPATETLRLGVEGNDGFRLYVDGTLLVDRWAKRGYSSATATLPVTKGRTYALQLEYFENTGAGRVRLVWDHATSTDWRGEIARAAGEARASDVAVVVVGIEEGEFRDRASLRLPGHQEALVQAVAATGRPVVVVVVGGSAFTNERWGDQVGAIVQAWYPGEAGGEAVADVLFGDAEPSGRLPFTIPVSEGQLPLTYFHKPTGRGDDYVDLTGKPRYPFGHGLGYSRVAYRDLTAEPREVGAGDSVLVTLRLRNEGIRRATEVVQLYLRHEVAAVARPVLALAGVARVPLAVGEEREVRLWLAPDAFTFLDQQLQRRREPGRFVLMAGASSADIRLRTAVTLR
ncbi:MAG: glycoside hydrolase family 3 N-terminal domain-containing protein [Gemmatimonadota bacterium]